MSANNILPKAETAGVRFIQEQDLGDIPKENVTKGASARADDSPLPNVVFSAEKAEAHIPNEGNWLVSAEVRIRSNADDDKTGALHEARCDRVIGPFFNGEIMHLLSSACADFEVFQVVVNAPQMRINHDRSWITVLPLELECIGRDCE